MSRIEWNHSTGVHLWPRKPTLAQELIKLHEETILFECFPFTGDEAEDGNDKQGDGREAGKHTKPKPGISATTELCRPSPGISATTELCPTNPGISATTELC